MEETIVLDIPEDTFRTPEGGNDFEWSILRCIRDLAAMEQNPLVLGRTLHQNFDHNYYPSDLDAALENLEIKGLIRKEYVKVEEDGNVSNLIAYFISSH